MLLSKNQQIEMYRRMLRIRYFEEILKSNEIAGHLSMGQEAAIVGSCLALRDDDYITGTHRSHGHPIGKGAELKPLMAEIFGKTTGICKGRGGSMHLADNSVGIIGESAIVGGGIPLATGAGFSAQVRATDQVSLCFFGDGASNQGTFHESINMAAVWNLPVVYLCENNGYAMSTSVESSHGQPDIAKRADGYGIPGVIVDGQDALAVYEATCTAVERARRGEGPTLIEAKTYRYDEHCKGLSIPVPYRSEEEIEHYRVNRDPLDNFKAAVLAVGEVSEVELAAIEQEVDTEVADALSFAKESPFPDAADIYKYMFSNPIHYPVQTEVMRDLPSSVGAPTSKITYMNAIVQAQKEEMLRDERVVLIGEEIAIYGCWEVEKTIGSNRVRNTPISENSFTGMAVGAAMTGLRPIVDLTIASFVYLASDQIINQAAKLRFMTGGQMQVPAVFRASMYYDVGNAAQHADRPYAMFLNTPGLKILIPSTASDMKGLMKSAIRDDDPVLIFEDINLWAKKEEVSEDLDFLIPIGKAEVKREGSDVTVITIGASLHKALAAAKKLEQEGISVEVVDPRTIVPLDKMTLIESVAKTGRVVIVDQGHRTGSVASEIAAVIAEEAFESLAKPVLRVTTLDVHPPASIPMERPIYPSAESITEAVKRLMA